jgi:aryl-alcohol dehydrogenase-like predicted oxidoreductase
MKKSLFFRRCKGNSKQIRKSNPMKYNSYIKGGIPVSEIGLGAWQIAKNSGWRDMTEKEARGIVDKALELGINFFDTAPNYGHGSGEERLGNALKDVDRNKIVINTKFGHTASGRLNFDSSYIRESLEGSLKRLGIEYVDSLIIHNPPFEYLDGTSTDHYDILEKLVDEGKIRAYGASLDTAKDIQQLLDTTGAKVIEAFFNILHQDVARIFDKAREKEVAIIAKVPLDSGWLSGKYHSQSRFSDIRSRWTKKDIENRARLVRRIKERLSSKSDRLLFVI